MQRIRNRINDKLDQSIAPIDKQQLWANISQDDRFPRPNKKRRFLLLFLLGIGLLSISSIGYLHWSTPASPSIAQHNDANHASPTTPATNNAPTHTSSHETTIATTTNTPNQHNTPVVSTPQARHIPNTDTPQYIPTESPKSIVAERATVQIDLKKTPIIQSTTVLENIPTKQPPLVAPTKHHKLMTTPVARTSKKWRITAAAGIGYSFHQLQSQDDEAAAMTNFRNQHTQTNKTNVLHLQLDRKLRNNWLVGIATQSLKHEQKLQHSRTVFSGYVPNPDPSGPDSIYTDVAKNYTLFHYYNQFNIQASITKQQVFKYFSLEYSIGIGLHIQTKSKGNLLSPTEDSYTALATSPVYQTSIAPFAFGQINLRRHLFSNIDMTLGIQAQTPSLLTTKNASIKHQIIPVLGTVGLSYSF